MGRWPLRIHEQKRTRYEASSITYLRDKISQLNLNPYARLTPEPGQKKLKARSLVWHDIT